MKNHAKILIVDDEPIVLKTMKDILLSLWENYEIHTAISGEDALEMIGQTDFDVLVTDVLMPEMDGIELMRKAKGLREDLQTVVITGHGELDNVIEALRAGAVNYLQKPPSGEILHYAVLNAWEKKRGIEQRKNSEKRYRTLFDNAGDAIIVHNFTKRILDTNQYTTELLGYSGVELAGMSLEGIVSPKYRTGIQKRISGLEINEPVFCEFELVTKREETIPVEAGSRVIELNNRPAVLTIARDIRERKKSEAKQREFDSYLRQTRKLEAIGTLASGIAHDFNNILSIMIGNVELAMDDAGDKDQVLPRLEETKTMILRAKDLIRRILKFSRQDTDERFPLDLGPVIREVLELFRSTLPANIEIRESIQECGNVLADTAQMNQVAMNLLANAWYAMRQTGGVLDICLRETESMPGITELEGGPFVEIAVADTGIGMDRETLDQVFDPYFTTKAKSRGTGLGLSVVHGIVKNHGGHVFAESQPGIGSVFRVLLPIIDESETPGEACGKTESPAGNERILVVDDEIPITQIMDEILGRLGYTVTQAYSGIKALETFCKTPDDFDLVATDLDMPEMTGLALAEQIWKIRPGIPIILCTGFGDMIAKENAKALGFRKLMMKPILPGDLALAIRQILDA